MALLASISWVCATGLATAADTLAPGEYRTQDGAARLHIEAHTAQGSAFRLSAQGANDSACDIEGKAQGLAAHIAIANNPSCELRFAPRQGGYEVSSPSGDACRYFCGSRAGYAYEYLPLPSACTDEAVRTTRARFDQLFQSKAYPVAAPVLTQLLKNCGNWMDWPSMARVRNDLAITQYHLSQKAACRQTLAPVLKVVKTNPTAMQLALPPAEFQNYQPIAKATWFNQKLCTR